MVDDAVIRALFKKIELGETMQTISIKNVLASFALAAVAIPAVAQQPPAPPPPQGPMSFFVTSVGKGDGANLGGLAGADAHCQSLAAAAGRGNATWRAYLSAAGAPPAAAGQPAQPQVHARDRIGRGPWFNARGVPIAWNVDDLHQDRNNIRKPTALNEKGEEVNGVGPAAEPARHADGLRLPRHARTGQRAAHDLQQLDEQRHGQRDRRSPRPVRRTERVVELGAQQP